MGPFHPESRYPPPPHYAYGYREGSGQQGYGPPYPQPWPSHVPPPPLPRTEGKAVASIILGILSLAFVGAFAGLPAIVLGAMARKDIERSNGGLSGRRLAAGGIVSGLFGTGLG